jgi:hypothetical protein
MYGNLFMDYAKRRWIYKLETEFNTNHLSRNMITPYSNIISVTTLEFPFEFTINTANTSAGSTASDQFKLPLVSSLPLNAVVDWGDGSSDTITVFNQAETTHTYATYNEFTISITGDLSGWKFNNGGDKLKMKNVIHGVCLLI